MNDAKPGTIQGLKAAIQAELEGHHFYRMAAQATSDIQGKEVFLQLAGEEMDHAEFLRKQLYAVQESGRADPLVILGKPTLLEGGSPIFSEKLRGRINEAHFEMTALSVGMQLEETAVHHYRKMAEISTDDTMKAFFLGLADWERGHLEALARQQKSLLEDYWHAAGFEPF